MDLLKDAETFFVAVEQKAVAEFDTLETKVSGVIAKFRSSPTGATVAQIIEQTSIGTKVENLISSAEHAATPVIDLAKHIAGEIADEVKELVGEVDDLETLALAAAATAISDFRNVVNAA